MLGERERILSHIRMQNGSMHIIRRSYKICLHRYWQWLSDCWSLGMFFIGCNAINFTYFSWNAFHIYKCRINKQLFLWSSTFFYCFASICITTSTYHSFASFSWKNRQNKISKKLQPFKFVASYYHFYELNIALSDTEAHT